MGKGLVEKANLIPIPFLTREVKFLHCVSHSPVHSILSQTVYAWSDITGHVRE